MNDIIWGYILSLGYGIACLLVALVFYKLGMDKKYTRKIVHILVGFEWVILYRFMGAGVHFLMVCVFFLLLLVVAHKGRLMPMISSEGDNSPGTVYYAVAMTGVAIVGCFIPAVMLPFGIGIMCTSIGDGFAGAVGQLITKHNPKVYKNKSLYGSIANLLTSFASAFLLSHLYGAGLAVWECISIAILSVGLELVVGFGLDNIAITWGITAFAYSLMYFEAISGYILPIVLTPFIIAFVLQKKALTPWGTVGAIFMDAIVSIAFGNFGFVIMVAFFMGSILIDKFKKRALSRGREDETKKSGTRDLVQVLANGLVPTVCACAFVFSDANPIFAVAFVASFAEAFADTAASGVGAFAKRVFDPFKWRTCENGLSGGMSVVGTASSVIASATLPAVAILLTNSAFDWRFYTVAAISAFVGVLFDSMLGSLLQVKYKCTVCGKITEKTIHCDKPTDKHSGFAFVDNDLVNLSSGFFSAVLAVLILIFL